MFTVSGSLNTVYVNAINLTTCEHAISMHDLHNSNCMTQLCNIKFSGEVKSECHITNDERSVTSHPAAHVISPPRSHLSATIATHRTFVSHAPVHNNDVIVNTDPPEKTEARHARSSAVLLYEQIAVVMLLPFIISLNNFQMLELKI